MELSPIYIQEMCVTFAAFAALVKTFAANLKSHGGCRIPSTQSALAAATRSQSVYDVPSAFQYLGRRSRNMFCVVVISFYFQDFRTTKSNSKVNIFLNIFIHVGWRLLSPRQCEVVLRRRRRRNVRGVIQYRIVTVRIRVAFP